MPQILPAHITVQRGPPALCVTVTLFAVPSGTFSIALHPCRPLSPFVVRAGPLLRTNPKVHRLVVWRTSSRPVETSRAEPRSAEDRLLYITGIIGALRRALAANLSSRTPTGPHGAPSPRLGRDAGKHFRPSVHHGRKSSRIPRILGGHPHCGDGATEPPSAPATPTPSARQLRPRTVPNAQLHMCTAPLRHCDEMEPPQARPALPSGTAPVMVTSRSRAVTRRSRHK